MEYPTLSRKLLEASAEGQLQMRLDYGTTQKSIAARAGGDALYCASLTISQRRRSIMRFSNLEI